MYIAIIIAVIVLFLVFFWIGTSNNFKRKTVKIDEALSGIEVAMTKRYDMLTKLLDTVKSFAAHEKDLFTKVINLRRGMPVEDLNKASEEMDTMSSKLFAVAEAYPELRSAEVFRELQAGIRDAEEHLQAARRLYNSSVSAFNTAVAVFPSSIVAGSQHLEKKEFFTAEETKKNDVKINI